MPITAWLCTMHLLPFLPTAVQSDRMTNGCASTDWTASCDDASEWLCSTGLPEHRRWPQITTDHRTLTLTLILTPTRTVHLRWSAVFRQTVGLFGVTIASDLSLDMSVVFAMRVSFGCVSWYEFVIHWTVSHRRAFISVALVQFYLLYFCCDVLTWFLDKYTVMDYRRRASTSATWFWPRHRRVSASTSPIDSCTSSMWLSSLKITNRSFRYASPHLWNQLSVSFRQPCMLMMETYGLSNSSSTCSPLSSSIIHSVFHSRFITHVFHKFLPP